MGNGAGVLTSRPYVFNMRTAALGDQVQRPLMAALRRKCSPTADILECVRFRAQRQTGVDPEPPFASLESSRNRNTDAELLSGHCTHAAHAWTASMQSPTGSTRLGWCRTVTTAEFDSTYRAVLHHIQTYADSRYLGIAVEWTSRMSASRSTP